MFKESYEIWLECQDLLIEGNHYLVAALGLLLFPLIIPALCLGNVKRSIR